MLLNLCRSNPTSSSKPAGSLQKSPDAATFATRLADVARYPLLLVLLVAAAQAAAPAPSLSSEARTARALEAAAKSGPAALRGFLYAMPKGADLHMHLTGAIYAESFLRVAAQDGFCIDPVALAITRPIATTRSIPPQPVCGEGKLRADTLTPPTVIKSVNQHLYDALIDSFSMRTFVPTAGNSGHDHFFDTFDKFDPVGHGHLGIWLDEVATRAAAQNEQYLEIMHTPSEFHQAAELAEKVGYHNDFAQYRQLMLDAGLRKLLPAVHAEFDQGEKERNQLESCGTPQARLACKVEIRYLDQVLRGLTRESVFAQILLGFEIASADPRVVGFNLVMPEDGYVSMADYRLHMQMIDALHAVYPKVRVSLHAGELAFGMVPPEGLKFHIRSAVEQGHAERIGHGVDVMDEDRPDELLKEMARKRVMVEINLTSNDVILNVKGDDHPLAMYRKFGVPVALSTDDEGVSRIDLTNEYLRAVTTYHFTYRELKDMVRTGLEHSFLPGESLWQQPTYSEKNPAETFTRPAAACATQLGQAEPKGKCADYLKGSEKGQQEWELEHRFKAYEASH